MVTEPKLRIAFPALKTLKSCQKAILVLPVSLKGEPVLLSASHWESEDGDCPEDELKDSSSIVTHEAKNLEISVARYLVGRSRNV